MTTDTQDTSPSLQAGMLLAGKYRVDRLLGEGGMGVVLAATNEALRQKVAIKLLRSGALANAKTLGRFEREARAAASLRSEHVARVLDVGKLEDGRPFMVMEYLEGCDLGDVIARGPYLPVGELVDYVLQACEAVAEAHAAGIIHRDLKPRNLFLATTIDGRPLVKVLDFGISKTEDAPDDLSLTRTTEILGSPSYMSPEQLRASKDVDIRTDIWALGVILYELLSKTVPFRAATVTELVAVVLLEPTPDVRTRRADVPDGIVYAINRCLAKNREERFASIAELVGALAPFGSGALASMTERVSRLAQASSRALPPSDTGSGPYARLPSGTTGPLPPLPAIVPPAVFSSSTPAAASGGSSARLAVNGGTSVAWGETQVDSPQGKRHRSRAALAAVLLGLGALLGVAGVGAVVYVKRAQATPLATTPAELAPPETLPMGRKDLPPPPSASTATSPEPMAPEGVPSALPTSRVPVTGSPRARPLAPPRSSTHDGPLPPAAPPPTATKPPDDLSDIGRH